MLIQISSVQPYLPARVKFALKPLYRKIFPNRLHISLLPTNRCNYRCSYCMVVTKFDFAALYPKGVEKTAAEWHAALHRLPPAGIYIQGGEPFLYPELPELVNDLPKRHELLGIVTNLSLPASVYRKIKRKIHLNASLHREYVSDAEFLDKVKELSAHFHIHVNIVATPENLGVLQEVSRLTRSRKVSLHVDPFKDPQFRYTPEQSRILDRYIQPDRNPGEMLDYEDYSPKRCSAGRNYMALMPNGDAFTCVAGYNYLAPAWKDVLHGREQPQFQMGNVFDSAFRMNGEDVVCALPCPHGCDRDAARIRPA